MTKLITASHGPLAEAIKESARLFFGDAVDEIPAFCLNQEDDPMEFQSRIQEKIEEFDDGDGVLILADLFGGTPFNMAGVTMDALKDSHHVVCLSGMNLPLFMEAFSMKDSCSLKELMDHLKEISSDTIRELEI